MRHAAWRKGNLSWLLHDGAADPERGQKAAYRLAKLAPSRVVVYDIARRWGKSFLFAVEAIETCLTIERARVPYACGTITSLREFIIPIFQAIIATAPDELRPELVKDELRFPHNGSRVVFAACEDLAKAERLRGPKSHKIIVDEAGFIPVLKYVVDSVLLWQLAGTGGKLLMGSSPPDSPAHPFVEYYKQADAQGAAMTATILDTPMYTSEDIAELCAAAGGPDSIVWQREGLAKFLTDPSRALVPEFSTLKDAIVQEYTPAIPHGYHEPAVDRYIVGDLGFVDLTFVLFAEWDFHGSMLYVVDEYVEAHATTDEVQQRVHTKARGLWGDKPIFRRVIDATARARADLVKLQADGDPTAENAWRLARNQERDAAVNQLRLAIGRLSWRINPRCKRLIQHLEGGVWKKTKEGLKGDFDRPGGELGHYDGVAASMYLEREVVRAHNPYGPVKADHFAQIVPASALLPRGSDAERMSRLRVAFSRPRKT